MLDSLDLRRFGRFLPILVDFEPSIDPAGPAVCTGSFHVEFVSVQKIYMSP